MKKLIEYSKSVIWAMAKALFVLVMIMSFSQLANAEGGKHGQPDNSYITVPDGQCVTLAVAGIDLEDCELSPSSPQSGLQSWICPPDVDDEGNVIVICSDVEADDDS